jgi:hypothetical protein
MISANSILSPGLSCRTSQTHHTGLADAKVQLITGHTRRETLAVYQDIALDGGLEAQYQATMREVDLWRRRGHRPVGCGERD